MKLSCHRAALSTTSRTWPDTTSLTFVISCFEVSRSCSDLWPCRRRVVRTFERSGVRFQVLTDSSMKCWVVWVVAPRSLGVDRRFRGAYCDESSPWWRQYAPHKRQFTPKIQSGATSQKSLNFMNLALGFRKFQMHRIPQSSRPLSSYPRDELVVRSLTQLSISVCSWHENVINVFVTSCLPRRPWFAYQPVRVGFVVDQLALGQVFLRVLRFSPVNIIPPWLSTLNYQLGDEQ
jgi:hypothetical protein